MSSPITSAAHVKDLFPGLKRHFEGELGQYPDEYAKLFDTESSDKRYEERVQRTNFGLAAVKPEGEGITYDSAQEGYTSRMTNVTYALGFKLTEEAIEDNQYMDPAMQSTSWLARSLKQTKEHVAANVYNRGFNTSYTGGDGKALMVADHPSLSGDQSNVLATAADLAEASLEDMVIQIGAAVDDRGNVIQLRPKRLIVPNDLIFDAQRILKSELQSGTANNDINALKVMGSVPEVAANHYLTDADAWFIRTDIPEGEGLIHQERRAARFKEDGDFDTANACFKADERYAFGWASWRAIYGTPGAA